jgi:hypothetical protein
MAKKVTVYVEEELHRRLKAAASQTLSDFMLQAARLFLEMPDRRQAAQQMDHVRTGVTTKATLEELRTWREEGRS